MRTIVWICIVGQCLALLSAQNQPKEPDQDVAVMIGDHKISKQEVFDLFTKRYRKEAYEIVQELAVRWIIREESRQEGVKISQSLVQEKGQEEIAKAKQELANEFKGTWEEYLSSQGISDKEFVQECYTRCKYNLVLARLVRLSELRQIRVEARHIMVKNREKAEEILVKLRQQADFATLAKQESVATTAKEGGLLPSICRGEIHASLEEVLFNLQPNELSGVIQSPWGFHILQLLTIFPARANSTWKQLETEVIESLAKNTVAPRDIQRWLKTMEAKYKVKTMFR